MSDVSCLLSDVGWVMSDVRCLMNFVKDNILIAMLFTNIVELNVLNTDTKGKEPSVCFTEASVF